MTRVAALEQQRRQEQARLEGEKDAQARNRLGQFATPFPLALEMAQLAAEYWKGKPHPVNFFDPGFGSGVFYSALLHTFPAGRIGSALGVEIDHAFAAVARTLWEPLGIQVIENDFTQLALLPESALPNLVMCNPPYSRHHHLEPSQKAALQAAVQKATGLWLNGLAGLSSYFLLLSHRWLKPDSLSIWLIPSEFMEVNYGQAIRTYLSQHVTLKRLHRFDASDVQFVDALVSSAVVVFENKKPIAGHQATFTVGGTLSRPHKTYTVRVDWLSKARKWTRAPEPASQSVHTEGSDIMFGSLFRTRRGLATGANNYFILSRQAAAERGLPEKFLKPILPSPRYLKDRVIEADAAGLPLTLPQLLLLDCDLPEELVQAEYPTLWDYFEYGKKLGIPERYLASKRTPWYRQEQIPFSPFLCTYMGRSQKNKSPLRFIWNQSTATVANVYHVVYPRDHLLAYLGNSLERQAQVFRLLTQIDGQTLISAGRTYGGGLHKIEPHELYRVNLNNIPEAKELVNATQLF